MLARRVVLAVAAALAAGGGVAARTLPGLHHEYQRLNNCGPVTAEMTLSLYGVRVTQARAAAALKTSARDRNVSMTEMAAYLERFGLRTVRRWAGDAALVRALVDAGFPVILHQQMKTTDDIGHYRVAYGFDSAAIVFGDSYLGPRVRLDDATVAALWRPYGGEFIVAYPPEREAAVRAALGAMWSRAASLRRLERDALARASATPGDALAWWNLGVARLFLGDARAAAPAFRRAEFTGLQPKHYWYQQEAFAAWNRVGWFDLTRRVASRVLEAYPNSTEVNLALAGALRGLGRVAAARRALEAVLLEDPNDAAARAALGVGGG